MYHLALLPVSHVPIHATPAQQQAKPLVYLVTQLILTDTYIYTIVNALLLVRQIIIMQILAMYVRVV